MKNIALIKGFETKTEAKSVLYLILLHRPDYGYHIAATFKELRKSNEWDIKNTKILSIPSKVTALLNEMERENLIKFFRAETILGKERKYYEANAGVLGIEFFSNELSELFDELLNIYRKARLPKNVWINPISQLTKFDYITILGFVQQMVRDGSLITNVLLSNNMLEHLFSEEDEEFKNVLSFMMFEIGKLVPMLRSISNKEELGEMLGTLKSHQHDKGLLQTNMDISSETINDLQPNIERIKEIVGLISKNKAYGSLLNEAMNTAELLKNQLNDEGLNEKNDHEIYRISIFIKTVELLEKIITRRIESHALKERGFTFPSLDKLNELAE